MILEHATTIYSEASLVWELESGYGFVLHGPPTMGKSRTLYEVVTHLRGWTVVIPRKDRPVPSTEAFDVLLAEKKVVLLLDDLNDYAGATVDLSEFCGANGLGRAKTWAIAATCRDGPELGVVKEARGLSLRRFYDEISLKLTLLPQTDTEKAGLARSAGLHAWDQAADDYPTPGTIVMAEALRFMRTRFELLPAEPRDALRAMKLLAAAAVLPITPRRLQAVMNQIFNRPVPHLGDCLEDLGNQAFIRLPVARDPVLPESAYLQDSVAPYGDGRMPEDDFPALAKLLEELGDAEALFFLGHAYAARQDRNKEALATFDAALRLRPNDPDTINNKGVILDRLGRGEEALAAYNASLRLRPDDPSTLNNKGASLAALGRIEEALVAYDASLRRRPNHSDTMVNRARALFGLDRPEEALATVDAALRLRPETQAHSAAREISCNSWDT